MKRNLRFWTRFTGESAAGELVVVAVLLAITTLGADRLQLEVVASVVPYFLCVSAVLCMIMINLSCHTLYIPLLLSLGETRRNIFFGFHYYRALIITVTLALSALIWALAPCDISSIGLHSMPTLLTVLVIASSLGGIMGTLFTKWKWVGMILVVLICGGMGDAWASSSPAARRSCFPRISPSWSACSWLCPGGWCWRRRCCSCWTWGSSGCCCGGRK